MLRALARAGLAVGVLSACACCIGQSQDGQRSGPRYSIHDLGAFPGRDATFASDINNQGVIVGRASDAGEENAVALVWDQGKPTRLPGLPGYSDTTALALNEAGQVAGSIEKRAGAVRSLYGCLWVDRKPRVLGSFGGQFGTATDINASGEVVGWSDTKKGVAHAWRWSRGKLLRLPAPPARPHSNASSINDTGQIAGFASDTSDAPITRAVLWEQGRVKEIGTLGGKFSFASSINNPGQAAGEAATAKGEIHAFFWQKGKMTDLGTLGGEDSHARDLNNLGQVVGTAGTGRSRTIAGGPVPTERAFLWEKGKMLDLNTLIPRGSGWELVEAAAINDRGQIVGWGLYEGRQRPFLLAPKDMGGAGRSSRRTR